MQKDMLRGADSASCQKQRAAEIVSMCVQALTDQRLYPELVLAFSQARIVWALSLLSLVDTTAVGL